MMSRKEFIAVLIITFIVIMAWIITDIIHTKPSVQLSSKIKTLLTPVSSEFDKNIIEEINSNLQQIRDVSPDLTPISTPEPLIESLPLPKEDTFSSESAELDSDINSLNQ